jgi:hypothetical protein
MISAQEHRLLSGKSKSLDNSEECSPRTKYHSDLKSSSSSLGALQLSLAMQISRVRSRHQSGGGHHHD